MFRKKGVQKVRIHCSVSKGINIYWMITGGSMALFKKIIRPLGLMTFLFIMTAPLGFTGTSTNPTITKPPAIQKEKPLPVVDPAATYKKSCGQCHGAFPPEFLPSGSWEKILGSMEKHFEDSVDIDKKTKTIIIPYLKINGAEFSKAKIPRKIMNSLEDQTPLRITEIPYIIIKHRKITPEDFKRKPIGSFTNCGACHLLADEWIFNKKIVIPEYEGASLTGN